MTYMALALGTNLICAALMVIASYGYLISPIRSVVPSYLGLAFPFFLIANIIFIIFWALQRKWWFLISLIVLLACNRSINDYTPFHRTAKEQASKDSLTILTYNVNSFDALTPHTHEHPNKIIEYIARSGADIVCMQEFACGDDRSMISEKQIDKGLSDYPYHIFSEKSKTPYSKSGIACYSKYPIIESREIVFGNSTYNSSWLYKINVNGRILTLINNHLESNKFTSGDRELYQYMIKHLETNMLGQFKERLVQKMGVAYKLRSIQAEQIANEIKNAGENIIVCGDFNDIPQSYTYRKVRGKLNDAYVATGFGPGITYNKNMFWFRIDHILYGKTLKAVSTHIGDIKASDHYPVKATLVWNDNIENKNNP